MNSSIVGSINSNLIDSGKVAIMKGSKSFSIASLFFGRSEKEAAWLLYSWCRFVDDEIDQAPTIELARQKLCEIENRTQKALADHANETGPYQSLGIISKKFSFNHKYPLDLIAGLRMDVEGAEIKDEAYLLNYCYCVAGTVGLMMCAVMGVRSEKAFPHALALGQAMQLTNIARDIAEDLSRHRIYIPRTWLADEKISEQQFEEDSDSRIQLSTRLLDLADQSYKMGFQGLKYLSFRSALAIAIAAYIYRAIGDEIRNDIPKSQRQRTVISLPKKIWLALQASMWLIQMRATNR